MRSLVLLLLSGLQLSAYPLACFAQPAGHPTLRATGFAELPAEIVITCNNGQPAASAAPLPRRTLTVTALDGVEITAKDLAVVQGKTWTDAFLFIDEPFPLDLASCAAPDGICPGTGSGNGIGIYGPRAKNAYQGFRVSPSAIQFTFPWDDPGDLALHILRITNLRVNANQVPLSSWQSVRMNVQWDGPPIINSSSIGVGLAQEAMNLYGTYMPLPAAGSQARVSLGTLRLIERFYTAWRRRSIRLPIGDPDPRLAHVAPPPTEPQDILGTIYQTETGFYRPPTAFSFSPWSISGGNPADVGLADSGTRIIVRFISLTSGSTIQVPGRVPIRDLRTGARTGTATLVVSDRFGGGPFVAQTLDSKGYAALPIANGQATGVWEVLNSDTTNIEEMQLEIFGSYPPGSPPVGAEVFLGPARLSNGTPTPAFAIRGGTESNCAYSLRPRQSGIPAIGGIAEIEVDTSPGCGWTANFVGGWVQWDSSRNYWQGKGVVRLKADENIGPARSQTVTIQGQPITITQGASGAPLPPPVITAPSELQQVPGNAVTLAWQPVAGATGYSISIAGSFGGASDAAVTANNGSALLSLPTGDYVARVRACSGGYQDGSCGPYSTTRFFRVVEGAFPSASTTIIAPVADALLTTSTNEFRWQPVAGASWYRVTVIGLQNASVRVDAPATSTILTLPSGYYQLTVTPCSVGCARSGAQVSFGIQLQAIPTTAPVITRADVTGGNQLDAAWNAVPGADLYQIQVVQPNTGPGGGALTVAARQVSTTSLRIGVPAGPASLLVAACTGDGCGPFSIPAPINPSGPNPAVPSIGTPMAGVLARGPAVLFTWNRIPGDNGTNTTYRLYVADLSQSATAADVHTTENFAPVVLLTDGRRYDAVVVANPGTPGQVTGPATGFQLTGTPPRAPAMVAPGHNSRVQQGVVRLGWGPFPDDPNIPTSFQYYVTSEGGRNTFTGMAAGSFVELPLAALDGQPTRYSAVIRLCTLDWSSINKAACRAESDMYWGPWSNMPGGSGVTNFTVIP